MPMCGARVAARSVSAQAPNLPTLFAGRTQAGLLRALPRVDHETAESLRRCRQSLGAPQHDFEPAQPRLETSSGPAAGPDPAFASTPCLGDHGGLRDRGGAGAPADVGGSTAVTGAGSAGAAPSEARVESAGRTRALGGLQGAPQARRRGRHGSQERLERRTSAGKLRGRRWS